jgi:two-component system response regulator DegU
VNLLIVDDSAVVRQLIADIVAPFAGEIHECADGADAVLAYDAQRPDLVLMDIHMSVMNGIEATKRICAAHPAAKVIIVTGFDDAALRLAAMQAGACAYALKDNLLELPGFIEALASEKD